MFRRWQAGEIDDDDCDGDIDDEGDGDDDLKSQKQIYIVNVTDAISQMLELKLAEWYCDLLYFYKHQWLTVLQVRVWGPRDFCSRSKGPR